MADPQEEAFRRAQRRVGLLLKEKWRIDRVLGVGGFGAVYAATHRTRKRVAIKILHPELSLSGEMRARFLREAYAANTVDHPGVVSVFDDDTAEDGSAFLVMELCEGEPVDARAARTRNALPAPEVLFVADQLLDVLAAAHDKGILHRDVKPANLFLTRGGQLKVLDFGIARMREGDSATATRTGSLMGTPAFMPPEQARGEWRSVDGRTDLWAVGATMFTLLTGRIVHEARSAPEMLVFSMTRPAPLLASVWPGVPAALADVVDRALAFDKEARWPDARQMQAALRHACTVLLGAAVPGAPHVEAPAITPEGTPEGTPEAAPEAAPSPSMNRADAVAFANTLEAEKTTQVFHGAQARAGGGRTWLRSVALAGGGLVVGAGLLMGARSLLDAKSAPATPPPAETQAAPALPPASAPPPAAVPPPPVTPEPSAAPPATAPASASAPAQRRVPAGPHPRPPPEPVPVPQDPYSRRR